MRACCSLGDGVPAMNLQQNPELLQQEMVTKPLESAQAFTCRRGVKLLEPVFIQADLPSDDLFDRDVDI